MKRWHIVAMTLTLLFSCARDRPQTRSPAPANPPLQHHTLEDGIAFERGTGRQRDYRAAAKIYAKLCQEGCGDFTACHRFQSLASRSRGAVVDGFDLATLAGVLCDRGSPTDCVAAVYAGVRPLSSIQQPSVESCQAGDADACQFFLLAGAMSGSDGTVAEFRMQETEGMACQLGVLPACISLVQHAKYTSGVDTTVAEPAVIEACEQGDADACGALPGQSFSEVSLCEAGDYALCRRLAERNEQGLMVVDRSSRAAKVACAGGLVELCDPPGPPRVSTAQVFNQIQFLTQTCRRKVSEPSSEEETDYDFSEITTEQSESACTEIVRISGPPCPRN